MAGRETGRSPWWLAHGTELCGHCFQRYHYAMQHRCNDCDGPMCPQCVTIVRETKSAYCTECVPVEPGEKR